MKSSRCGRIPWSQIFIGAICGLSVLCNDTSGSSLTISRLVGASNGKAILAIHETITSSSNRCITVIEAETVTVQTNQSSATYTFHEARGVSYNGREGQVIDALSMPVRINRDFDLLHDARDTNSIVIWSGKIDRLPRKKILNVP